MVTNKNVDSITDKNAEANSKLLSPKERKGVSCYLRIK